MLEQNSEAASDAIRVKGPRHPKSSLIYPNGGLIGLPFARDLRRSASTVVGELRRNGRGKAYRSA